MQTRDWIDSNNVPTKLKNMRKIKEWVQQQETPTVPSTVSKDKEEKKLGTALSNIKTTLIKPYMQLKTKEDRLEFKRKYPEIDEVLQIMNWIDSNKVSTNLKNMRKIKEWMQQQENPTVPSANSKDKEEKKLGIALIGVKTTLIKPYMQLETEEDRLEFKRNHPELQEIMSVISELYMQCGSAKQKELANLIRLDLEKMETFTKARKLEKDYEKQLAIKKANIAKTQEQGVDIDE